MGQKYMELENQDFQVLLHKPPGFQVFCDAEVLPCINLGKYVLRNITFYSENNSMRSTE